jgi:hypothetical protein
MLMGIAGASAVFYVTMRLGEPIPAALRSARVQGLDGARRLGDLVRGPTLLVFLRYFG